MSLKSRIYGNFHYCNMKSDNDRLHNGPDINNKVVIVLDN